MNMETTAAPRRFDYFSARMSGVLPADPAQFATLSAAEIDKRLAEHQAKVSPGARAAVGVPSQPTAVAQVTTTEAKSADWRDPQLQSLFARVAAERIEREAAEAAGAATEATAASGRTSAARWELANAKVQTSTARVEPDTNTAHARSADRWERANAKIDNERRIYG